MKVFAASFLLLLPLSAQRPPERAKEFVEKMGQGEGTLKPGDMAPDFTLRKSKSEETVTLSSFRGKRPVALLFGSYT